jgi:hypothetical protein
VPGVATVTGCTDRGCTGRFTSDTGVVELKPVPMPRGSAGTVRMWLSPRESMPTPQPPRLWPTWALALAAILAPQVFLVVGSLVHERARRRGRAAPPSGWVGAIGNRIAVVIVVGGMLAWCSGAGVAGSAAFRTPGHVLGVECLAGVLLFEILWLGDTVRERRRAAKLRGHRSPRGRQSPCGARSPR